MPARDSRGDDQREMADLEKTFVPAGSMQRPPPPPPPPPAATQARGSDEMLIPPSSPPRAVTPPNIPPALPGKNKTVWIVAGCVGCALLALFVVIAAAIAYMAWQAEDHREKLLRPPVPVPERAAAGPRERPVFLTKSGNIIGQARFADGRPVPSFRVSAIAADGRTSVFVRETAGPSIAEVEGRDGRYELRAENSAKTLALRAIAQIPYRGRTYQLEMHPSDADISPVSATTSAGEGAPTATRNFVLKISGVRPGYDGRVVKETTSQDKPANAFYGGTIHLDLTYSEGAAYGEELARTPPDARILITLTPEGPLLDGSAGRPIIREVRPAPGQPNLYFHLHNIPLGVYTIVARRVDANGAATDLRLGVAPRRYGSTATIDFAPARTANKSGVENVTLFLVK